MRCAIDAHGDRLADLLVGQRVSKPSRRIVVEADVEDVHALARIEGQRAVSFDLLEVIRAGIVDGIHGAGLQFEQALSRTRCSSGRPGSGFGRSPQ